MEPMGQRPADLGPIRDMRLNNKLIASTAQGRRPLLRVSWRPFCAACTLWRFSCNVRPCDLISPIIPWEMRPLFEYFGVNAWIKNTPLQVRLNWCFVAMPHYLCMRIYKFNKIKIEELFSCKLSDETGSVH